MIPPDKDTVYSTGSRMTSAAKDCELYREHFDVAVRLELKFPRPKELHGHPKT